MAVLQERISAILRSKAVGIENYGSFRHQFTHITPVISI